VWGTGEEARDLIHVDDLVRFVGLCLERQQEPYRMLHAGSGRAIRIRDIVASIVAASGRDLRIEHDPAGPTIRTSFALDSSLAAEVIGWKPEVPFEDGVRRTVDWWRHAHAGAGQP
jgi:nucleoside-diphosphate-sugar epimerase